MTDQGGKSDGPELPVDTETIRDEQVRCAVRQLDNCGELTPEQRATVERLADRLTAELLDLFDADEQAETNIDANERRFRVSGLAVRENH